MFLHEERKTLEYSIFHKYFFGGNLARGFLDGTSVKNSSANGGGKRDPASIPGLGRFPGEGYGNPLQYSCLKNPMDRGAWWATVQGLQRVGYG